MPPSKRAAHPDAHTTSLNHDDGMTFPATGLAKQKLAAQATFNARAGRGKNGHAAAGGRDAMASLKDLANASEMTSRTAVAGSGNSSGIDWSSEPRSLLHAYAHAHSTSTTSNHLPTSSSYRNPSASYILSSGIGPRSPFMARASSRSQAERHKQRISKHDLAKAVARHFKEASVGGPEGDSVVELVYKVRFGDKAFRQKFPTKGAR